MWIVVAVVISKFDGSIVGGISQNMIYGNFNDKKSCETELMTDYAAISDVIIKKENSQLSVILDQKISNTWHVNQCIYVSD